MLVLRTSNFQKAAVSPETQILYSFYCSAPVQKSFSTFLDESREKQIQEKSNNKDQENNTLIAISIVYLSMSQFVYKEIITDEYCPSGYFLWKGN